MRIQKAISKHIASPYKRPIILAYWTGISGNEAGYHGSHWKPLEWACTGRKITPIFKGYNCSGSQYNTPPFLRPLVMFIMAFLRPHCGKATRPSKSILRLSSSARKYISPSLTDEEQSPNYNPQKYYPAQVGESIGKYRILSKLEWGVSSTAWLAKDVSR
jgi:hypothetical protein